MDKMTAREAMESLTGYDEIAIEKAFGKTLEELPGRSTVRALIFVLERRGGANDREAKDTALGLAMKDLDGYFAASEDEIDDEDPETDEGKGGVRAA